MLRARLWSAKHLIRSTFFRIFSPSKEIPFREKWMFRWFRTRWSCNLGCRVGLPPWLAASLFYSISPGINLFFRYTSWAAVVHERWIWWSSPPRPWQNLGIETKRTLAVLAKKRIRHPLLVVVVCLSLFKNIAKCHIWIFQSWHFSPIFVQLKLTCLVILFDFCPLKT